MKTEDERELLEVITDGVNKLEEKFEVKWSKSSCSYITKDKFILAIERTYMNNTQVWEELNYGNNTSFSRAMRKTVIDRISNTKWKKYILELSGHKQCNYCKQIKKLSEFYTRKEQPENYNYICKKCDNKNSKIYNKDNKEILSKKRFEKRKRTTLHIINVMLREGKIKEVECDICGYKENWAALEFHHINPELDRPEWTFYKNGKKKSPGQYIFDQTKETAERRYLVEMDNLQLLCANCHNKIGNVSITDSKSGMKEALIKLDYNYKCEKCDEISCLELHHNKENKEYTFSSFSNQSEKRILKDNFLKKEMEKDTTILCGNHHAEYHNPNWQVPII